MRQVLLLTVLVLLPAGCATQVRQSPDYRESFNQAVTEERTYTLISDLSFEELNAQVTSALDSLGYQALLYEETGEGFFAVSRIPSRLQQEMTAEEAGHVILVKFTRWKEEQMRVDFANAAESRLARKQVKYDINRLSSRLQQSGKIRPG